MFHGRWRHAQRTGFLRRTSALKRNVNRGYDLTQLSYKAIRLPNNRTVHRLDADGYLSEEQNEVLGIVQGSFVEYSSLVHAVMQRRCHLLPTQPPEVGWRCFMVFGHPRAGTFMAAGLGWLLEAACGCTLVAPSAARKSMTLGCDITT